jgi:hypothetical protein
MGRARRHHASPALAGTSTGQAARQPALFSASIAGRADAERELAPRMKAGQPAAGLATIIFVVAKLFRRAIRGWDRLRPPRPRGGRAGRLSPHRCSASDGRPIPHTAIIPAQGPGGITLGSSCSATSQPDVIAQRLTTLRPRAAVGVADGARSARSCLATARAPPGERHARRGRHT